MKNSILGACALMALAVALWDANQASAQDFPRATADPAAIARGQQVFSVNCGFCHGSNARGGEGGPNLLRSPIVLNDQNGELVSAIVLNGRIDIAAYVHSVGAGAALSKPFDPKSILVGNPSLGKKYFNGPGHCTSCHSVTKDLAGIGAKFGPKELNDLVFTGGATGVFGIPSPTAPQRIVKVTWPAGTIVQGRLLSVDDFFLILIDSDGNRRTIRRDGDSPMIQVTDPMKVHFDMSRTWEDRELHNVTAYLATLK
jgi:cytochrome c oxidase cbb3-type subunit 3